MTKDELYKQSTSIGEHNGEIQPEESRLGQNGNDDDDDDWLLSDDELPVHLTHTEHSATVSNDRDAHTDADAFSDSGVHADLEPSRTTLHDLTNSTSQAPYSQTASTAVTIAASLSMAQRDSSKMQNRHFDAGYRQGITAGKLDTLQAGFDAGFSDTGAPLGRRVGQLRGELDAFLDFVALRNGKQSSMNEDLLPRIGTVSNENDDNDIHSAQLARIRARMRARRGANSPVTNAAANTTTAATASVSASNTATITPSSNIASVDAATNPSNANAPLVSPPKSKQSLSNPTSFDAGIEELRQKAAQLALDRIAPPDIEAIAHERMHRLAAQRSSNGDDNEHELDGTDILSEVGDVETPEQRLHRECLLPSLEENLTNLLNTTLAPSVHIAPTSHTFSSMNP